MLYANDMGWFIGKLPDKPVFYLNFGRGFRMTAEAENLTNTGSFATVYHVSCV